MTILSGQTIRYLKLLDQFSERTEIEQHGLRTTHGLGPAGYDVRVEFDATGNDYTEFLEPGAFTLASTIERFCMPWNVMGIVHDKSSWARRGLAVQNTVIEPGWAGYLTLELTNHGKNPLWIPRGVGIAQIIFHFTDLPVEEPYQGKYQFQQRGPQEAR